MLNNCPTCGSAAEYDTGVVSEYWARDWQTESISCVNDTCYTSLRFNTDFHYVQLDQEQRIAALTRCWNSLTDNTNVATDLVPNTCIICGANTIFECENQLSEWKTDSVCCTAIHCAASLKFEYKNAVSDQSNTLILCWNTLIASNTHLVKPIIEYI